MRVAILIDAWLPFLGGGQKSVLEITKILRRKYGISFTIYHSVSTNLLLRAIWCLYVIPQVVISHYFFKKYDLIDSRAFLAGFPAKVVSLLTGIPVIFTVNGCGNLDRKTNGISFWIEKILLTGIHYDLEISDSRHFLKYSNVNKNIKVVPNGVDIDLFNKVNAAKEKKFTIFYAGRLAKIKGLYSLLAAMKDVIREDSTIMLKIAGRGEEEQKLKEYVLNNNLESNIRFLGMLKGDSLIRQYKSSHIFVLPSLAEGQPITLFEAWASALPVIATRVGSLENYITLKTGYLVKPGNSNQLAKTIIKAKNNKFLNRLGKNAYGIVAKNYTWKICASAYKSSYKNILKR